ncbi:MAG: TonB-dependent receptor plug domain-containing protein [Crocinitomicaceae bacterium]|nr:TonB-dependent receptor plug domain-containing protein [Crocinitomicaceae bacterium]
MYKWIAFIFLVVYSYSYTQEITVKGQCINGKKEGVSDILIRINDRNEAIYSGHDGHFSFNAAIGDSLKIQYYVTGDTINRVQYYYIKNQNSANLPPYEINIKQFDDVTIIKEIDKPFDLTTIKVKDWQTLPLQNIEHVLIFTSAARSNNELTSNYNVRGGNYDENLVYVNGFQIYRPFLTRAGQQEGMSFINSALVESLSFSAGGFDAQYGDKLSSVLDIKYRSAEKFKGSIMASMLGVEGHLEQQLGKKKRFSYLMGGRFRSNGYFLNALPTKGAYNPIFWDAQLLTDYVISENWTWSLLGHISNNNYTFTPQTQQTDFGTANEAYSFMVYFEGKEQTRFRTMMGGTKFAYTSNDTKTKLNFFASAFHSDEREYFDVQGQYYINQLETDPSKEEYGDSIAVLGVGTFLNHARNRLRATIFNVYHTGNRELKNGFLNIEKTKHNQSNILWGINFQMNDFYDVLSEWKMIDSAGYSLPQTTDHKVNLQEVIKGRLNLQSGEISGYTQFNSIWSKTKENYPVSLSKRVKEKHQKAYRVTFKDTIQSSASKWALTFGVRTAYTSVNNEFFVTPRASVMYYPRAYLVKDSSITRRNMSLRFSTGLYYQPPIYREMRTFTGGLNTNVRSQKSYHAVLGYDMFFFMWGRNNPFKFTTEIFYKYMWDVNPYEVENVRTRYYADNIATAYAYGIDFNLNGEFIEGISSYFKIGFMRTMENIKDDQYTVYYNAAGEKIIFGYSDDQQVVDSTIVKPGYIPRPTDQLLNIGLLIQDRMPNFEALSLQVGLQFGTPLPYGPPGHDRYKDTLRMKPYFRVDIGTSYDFLHNKHKQKPNFFNKAFTDVILSFEVYNLLGIKNEMSKQWIQDVNGGYYSIPNYLTNRRFNLKLILRF